MITLDCRVDEAEVLESWSYYPEATDDGGTLEQTGFYAYVSLFVDGRNIFSMGNHQTANVPLLGFVRFTREKLGRIQTGEDTTVHMGCSGSMLLQRRGRQLRLSTTFNEHSAEVYHEAVIAAINAFSEEVRRLIEERVPQMKQHPNWTVWFPGQRF